MFGLHSLPPIAERVIVQTWRITEPPIDGTRSIEYVGEQAFIVARHTDLEGERLGGNDGHLLERREETKWVSLWNGIVWQVQPNGDLAGFQGNELVFAGTPCEGLWG